MKTTTRPFSPTSARLWVLWCLLVALPIYGVSGTLIQLLGQQHFHAPHSAEPPVAGATSADPMADWQYFRRLGAGPPPPTQARGESAADTLAAEAEAPHSHDGLARHHHALGDQTVIALDGADHGDGLSGEGSAPASGLAAQLFVLANAAMPPTADSATCAWPPLAAAAPRSRHPDRLDRPPKA